MTFSCQKVYLLYKNLAHLWHFISNWHMNVIMWFWLKDEPFCILNKKWASKIYPNFISWTIKRTNSNGKVAPNTKIFQVSGMLLIFIWSPNSKNPVTLGTKVTKSMMMDEWSQILQFVGYRSYQVSGLMLICIWS